MFLYSSTTLLTLTKMLYWNYDDKFDKFNGFYSLSKYKSFHIDLFKLLCKTRGLFKCCLTRGRTRLYTA